MTSEAFRGQLLEAGILVDGGKPGLYHRSPVYETVLRSFETHATSAGRGDNPRRLFFSPVIDRATLEGSGYVGSFPNLLGAISSFEGDQRQLMELRRLAEAGDDWTQMMSPTNVSLCSAACHSVYPMFAHSALPHDGVRFEVQSFCFRHEPSLDPARMQSFRMQEFVYLGTAEGAIAFRDRWLDGGRELLRDLGLDLDVVPASDPFFGRGNELMATSQIEKALKFEIVAPISSENPGAISSANYHEDHFGVTFDMSTDDGSVAHSACFAFGLDRITLALFYAHGLDVGSWPIDVIERLAIPADQLAATPSP